MDSDDYFHESEAFDGENRRLHSPKQAKPEIESDLVRYRFYGPILKPGEERDLIRLAQAGDGRAQNELVRRFHRKVLKVAGEFHGPGFEDLVAAGILGLARAITEFDLARNNGLACFAAERIREEIRKEVKQWRRRGQTGETRADRYLFHHRHATAEEVSAATACTLADAEQAIARLEGYWHGHIAYDTNETGQDDDGEGESKRAAFVAVARATGVAYRHRLISNTIHAAAEYADYRAETRLREIGRRAFALELVNRKPYPARDLYPDDVADSRRPDFRARKRIVVPLERPSRVSVTPSPSVAAVGSYWNNNNLSPYRSSGTTKLGRSLNILPERLTKLEKHRSRSNWLLPPETKHGPYDVVRRDVRCPHVGNGPRRRRASG